MAKRKRTPRVQFAGASLVPSADYIIKREPDVKPSYDAKLMRDEVAGILGDIIRQYVGAASPFATTQSGVFMNADRVLLTQSYLELYGYDLYDEVERDPHISAVLMTRRLAVAGLEWFVQPSDSKDAKATEMASWVEEELHEIPSFTQDMVQLLDATGKGFAVSEILWDIDPEDGRIVPTDVMNRPQRRFQFDAVSRELKLKRLDAPFYGVPLPKRKFIIHRNSQLYENPFGDPIDQRLYWLWLFKRNITRFWMQFCEQSAAPVPIVSHPANANAALKAEALSVAQQIRNGGYGRIPSTFTIVWAEAKSSESAGKSYDLFLRWANDEISKCVLGQILTTEASGHSGTGSRALGGVHQTVRQDIMEFDAHSIEDTLNATLVKWMIDWNFADVKKYPRFQFKLEAPTDLSQIADSVMKLKQAGYKLPVDRLSEMIGTEIMETEPIAPPNPFGGGNEPPKKPDDPNAEPTPVEGDNAAAA